jgi:predicted nucleic acid-binding protein
MKKVYLLDTNIVSEFSKERPDEQVMEYYKARRNLCAVSAVTWQELTRGLARMPEGKRRATIQSFIDSLKQNMEVIPYDKFSADICGELQARAELDGRTLPAYDSQIASTAVANGMVLVTRNTEDLKYIKEKSMLRLENWFTAEF